MHAECNSVSLAWLGVLRAHGAGVVSFLQGQLSSDVGLLTAERSLLAGYHNPQGRVIALLRLVRVAPDEVLALLPRELVVPVAQRLAKFILRAKVQLSEATAQWTLTGVAASASPPAGAGVWPQSVNGVAHVDGAIAVRVAERPARWLLVNPTAGAATLTGCPPAAAEFWQRLVIAAGEPQVYAATSEEFVAQMLNLDVLGAVDFDKGCYTGQEVIARAHYRGRVKRRLQRFRAPGPLQLRPGDAGQLADGRSFKVVDAVPLAAGGCEFLAVAPLPGDATDTSRPAESAAAPGVAAEELALPYRLPG